MNSLSMRTLAFTCLTLTAEHAWSQEGNPLEGLLAMPSGCHAEAYREAAFQNFDVLPNEQKQLQQNTRYVWKYDVACIGREIIIDSPIHTNGGSVFILADRLRIGAPIDTRVYRLNQLPERFLPPAPNAGFYEGKYWPRRFRAEWHTYRTLTVPDADPAYGTQKLVALYKEYYGCKVCRTLGNEILVARMPDGGTPPFDAYRNVVYDGISAPDLPVERSAFTSGNVSVFAGRIESTTGPGRPPIVTTGLDGGFGGLGEPYPCAGWNISRGRSSFSCGIQDDRLSRSAPGGPGGDAGNIYLYSVDASATQLATLVDSGGGRGASTSIYELPDFSLRQDVVGSVADLKLAEKRPAAADGARGRVQHARLQRSELLPFYLRHLTLGSTFKNYSLHELADRSLRDTSVRSKSFANYVASTLDRDLRPRLVAIVRRGADFVQSGREEPPNEGPSLFCSTRPNDVAATGEIYILVTQLAQVCGGDGSPVTFPQYLKAIGGAFDIPNSFLEGNLQLEQIAASIALTDEALRGLQVQVNELATIANRTLESVELRRLDERKRDLENALRRLEEAKSKAKPGTAQLMITTVAAVASGGAALVVAYNAYVALGADGTEKDGKRVALSKDERKAQTDRLKRGLSDTFQNFSEARANWKSLTSNDASPTDESIRTEMRRVDQFSAELVNELQAQRNRLDGARLSFLDNVLLSRNRFATLERGTVVRAPDLVKALFTHFLADPTRDITRLKANIEALTLYINEFPTGSAMLRFRTIDPACVVVEEVSTGTFEREEENCIRIKSRAVPMDVFGVFRTAEGTDREVLLYALPAGPAESTLRLYGVSDYRVASPDDDGRSLWWRLLNLVSTF
jgi:hypothetical protein